MKLTVEHKALFCLLRAGLWEREVDDLSLFPLTDEQWGNVYYMAIQQTVAAIVYRGLHHLPEEYLPCESLMIRWVAKVDQTEQQNIKMNEAQAQLLRLLTDGGLKPVILKGQGVAAFYEYPLLRDCGDIDVFFPKKGEEQTATELLRKAGCSVERHPDGSNCYQWEDVEVEHHPRLFDVYNPRKKSYLAALVEKYGFDSVNELPVPSPIPNLLLLNTHLLKHLMGHGVGLRQFCDMARAYHSLQGQYAPKELDEVYKKVGLEKWSAQLHSFLTKLLGLNPDVLPSANKDVAVSQQLLEIVLEGGNFGQYGDTKGSASQPQWRRKMNTLMSFFKHSGFSFEYARCEALWTTVELIKGNLKLK